MAIGRKKHARVTITDVAKEAGVTPAIVSRVFNKDDTLNIKDDTRLAVLDAIKKLDYKPNSMARSLRLQSSQTVGVLISDILNPFYGEVMKGIQTAAWEAGYTVTLYDTDDKAHTEKMYIEKLSAQQVDGIMLCSAYIEDRIIEMLEEKDMKYVLVNRGSTNSNAPYVATDDLVGMMKAVNHVVSLGHRKIAHLAGPLYADTAVRRLSGYRKALYEADIPYNPQYVIETSYDEQSGYDGCKAILKLQDRATAICACNDMVAMGAIRAIHEAGLRVPEDISIVGYNDIWVASKIWPPLTTVRMPLHDMGKEAFNMLLKRFNKDGPPQEKKILPTTLVVRDSTSVFPQ